MGALGKHIGRSEGGHAAPFWDAEFEAVARAGFCFFLSWGWGGVGLVRPPRRSHAHSPPPPTNFVMGLGGDQKCGFMRAPAILCPRLGR